MGVVVGRSRRHKGRSVDLSRRQGRPAVGDHVVAVAQLRAPQGEDLLVLARALRRIVEHGGEVAAQAEGQQVVLAALGAQDRQRLVEENLSLLRPLHVVARAAEPGKRGETGGDLETGRFGRRAQDRQRALDPPFGRFARVELAGCAEGAGEEQGRRRRGTLHPRQGVLGLGDRSRPIAGEVQRARVVELHRDEPQVVRRETRELGVARLLQQWQRRDPGAALELDSTENVAQPRLDVGLIGKPVGLRAALGDERGNAHRVEVGTGNRIEATEELDHEVDDCLRAPGGERCGLALARRLA